jgi:hypothetical protein
MRAHCSIRSKQTQLLFSREYSPNIKFVIDDGLEREDSSKLDQIKRLSRKISCAANNNCITKQLIEKAVYMMHHHYLFSRLEIDTLLDVLKKEYASICRREIMDNTLLLIKPGIDDKINTKISYKINRSVIQKTLLTHMPPLRNIYITQKSVDNISQDTDLIRPHNFHDIESKKISELITQRLHKRNTTELYTLPKLVCAKAKVSHNQSLKRINTLHKLYRYNQSICKSIKLAHFPKKAIPEQLRPIEESTQTGRWHTPIEEAEYDITQYPPQLD